MGDVRQRLASLSSRYALRYAAVVAMVVTVTLGVPPEPTLLWNAVFDVGHVVVFAAITVILLDLVERRQAEPNPRAAVGWTVGDHACARRRHRAAAVAGAESRRGRPAISFAMRPG